MGLLSKPDLNGLGCTVLATKLWKNGRVGVEVETSPPQQVSIKHTNLQEVPKLLLRDFLAGHIIRKGMWIFEDALSPWVKDKVQAWFRDESDDTFQHRLDKHEVECQDHASRLAVLKKAMQLAAQEFREYAIAKDPRKAAADQKRKELGTAIILVEAEPLSCKPIPHWVKECRKIVGTVTAKHMHATNRWDTHAIVGVMRALLPDVFAPDIPIVSAKILLDALWTVGSMRNDRAHRVVLLESDVLAMLRHMETTLRWYVE